MTKMIRRDSHLEMSKFLLLLVIRSMQMIILSGRSKTYRDLYQIDCPPTMRAARMKNGWRCSPTKLLLVLLYGHKRVVKKGTDRQTHHTLHCGVPCYCDELPVLRAKALWHRTTELVG